MAQAAAGAAAGRFPSQGGDLWLLRAPGLGKLEAALAVLAATVTEALQLPAPARRRA